MLITLHLLLQQRRQLNRRKKKHKTLCLQLLSNHLKIELLIEWSLLLNLTLRNFVSFILTVIACLLNDSKDARLEAERKEREKSDQKRQEKLLAVISQTLNNNMSQSMEK